MNLEEPGEHPVCGEGLVSDKIGFSYDPELINNAGIAYFNPYWEDLTLTSFTKVLSICQLMDNFVKRAPGNKVFVHCHAGMGRTAIVCCSYLIFAGIATSGQDAIKLVQS